MDRQRTRRLEAEQNGADVARIVDTIGVQSRLRNSDALRRGSDLRVLLVEQSDLGALRRAGHRGRC